MANSRDKAGNEIAGAWTNGDPPKGVRAPASSNHALGLAKTALGLPVPQPDSLVIPATADDPVESLFRADQTLRAPSIPAAPSEAEVTRWRATARTSMFDENVSDPVPAPNEPLRDDAAAPAAEAAPALDPAALNPRAAARERARAAALAALGAPGPEPVRSPPAVRRMELRDPIPSLPVPPPPPAAGHASNAPAAPGAEPGPNAKGANRSAVHSKLESAPTVLLDPPSALQAPPDLTAEREPQSAPLPARKRRLQRGPRPAFLALLAAAALFVIGTVAVLIGLVDSPFSPPTQPATAMLAPPAASRPRPAAVKPPLPPPAPPTPPAAQSAAADEAAPEAAAAAIAAPPSAAPAPSQTKPAAAPAPAMAQAAPVAQPKPAQAPEAMPVADPEEVADEPQRARPAAATRAPGAANAEGATAVDGAAAMAAARKALADDEPARAETAMRALLAQDPQDHHAMELLVRALMDQDRGKDAVPFARRMVQRRSKRVAYRLLLGDVLLMAGDENAARAEWQQALELAPDDREIKRRLGM